MNDPAEVLRRYFGFDSFRWSQREIIDRVAGGGHAMVVAPTGSGKSLCFQIPALCFDEPDELTLVLSPLVALMQDQVTALRDRGIDAAFINSLLDRETRLQRYDEVADGKYRLLYVTPERFRKDDFLDVIARRNVRLLAVDEAHCVSQWGHDFRPDYSRVGEIRHTLGDPTTIALTATATADVRRDIVEQLDLSPDDVASYHEGIARPNLELTVRPVYDDDDKYAAIRELVDAPEYADGSVIVYFSLIKTLQQFGDRLLRDGVDHVEYHGDLGRGQRRRIQDEFMSGGVRTVLATGAFGMGVDKSDIRLIVHAETPGSIESYYQEIGRAGRDGRPSRCEWLYRQEDLATQMQFIEWANPDADFYGRVWHLLTEQNESCRAFGLDWMNERIQRVSRHDHRLDTAIAMLERYGVLAGPRPPECFDVTGELPPRFRDDEALSAKKLNDQRRLYAMVQLAGHEGDRQEFLREYFLGDAG